MEAGEYEAYADELFGVAADALLVPPMQVPQILVSWEPPPVCEPASQLGLPEARSRTLMQPAADAALPPPSKDPDDG